MTLTEKIDYLMKEKNINRATLSKQSGIPYTTLDGLFKKGADNVKLSTLKKLATYFECTLDYLVDDNTEIPDDIPTIAAHFDGDEYTEDELLEIHQFAEFIKNRKKQ